MAVVVKDRYVELRVHGVSGTPPECMLDDPYPDQVAGDDAGRVFRRQRELCASLHGDQHRVVEAFHWGKFTSGSPSRALWLLLLPFALLNMARFALLMPSGQRRKRDWFADLVLRLLGLTLTLTFVLTACYIGLDLAARQCVGAACARENDWLAWYADLRYGTRIIIGSLVPAMVLTVVWWFGRQSFQYAPPGPTQRWRSGNGSFDDVMFWRGAASAPVQRAAHVLAGCALIGVVTLGLLGTPAGWWPEQTWLERAMYVLLGLGCLTVGAAAVLLVAWNPKPRVKELRPDRKGHDPIALPRWLWRFRVWFAAPLVAACVLFTAVDAGAADPRARAELTGPEVAANVAAVICGLLLVIVLGYTAWIAFGTAHGRELRRDGTAATGPVPRAFRPFWGGLGAWMLTALSVTFAFGFTTAAAFWTAKALGTPVRPSAAPVGLYSEAAAATPSAATPPAFEVELPFSYWTAALIWGAIAAAVLLLMLPTVAWLLHRRFWLVLLLLAVAVTDVVVTLAGYQGRDVVDDRVWWFGGALAAMGLAVLWLWLPHDGIGIADRVAADYEDRGEDDQLRRSRKAVVRRWCVALARYRYQHGVGVLASIGGLAIMLAALAAVTGLLPLLGRQAPADARAVIEDGTASWVAGFGVSAVTAIAAGLVTLGIATWRRPGMRTTVGILWDLLSFWPRLAHPLCPPPYGGRAVLGVAVRSSQLVHDLDARRVVISGHSQGSVISVAACALLARQAASPPEALSPGAASQWLDGPGAAETLRRVSLVTYGSQLQFIYARLFPSFVGYAQLRRLYLDSLQQRWRNVYRWTDPLGGPVLSWPAEPAAGKAGYGPAVGRWTYMSCPTRPDAPCAGHEPAKADAEHDGVTFHSWTVGADLRLRDPDVVTEDPRQPRLPPRGHSGYPESPLFDRMVAQLADGSIAPPDGCPPPAPPVEPTVRPPQPRVGESTPAGAG